MNAIARINKTRVQEQYKIMVNLFHFVQLTIFSFNFPLISNSIVADPKLFKASKLCFLIFSKTVFSTINKVLSKYVFRCQFLQTYIGLLLTHVKHIFHFSYSFRRLSWKVFQHGDIDGYFNWISSDKFHVYIIDSFSLRGLRLFNFVKLEVVLLTQSFGKFRL